MKSIGALPSC